MHGSKQRVEVRGRGGREAEFGTVGGMARRVEALHLGTKIQRGRWMIWREGSGGLRVQGEGSFGGELGKIEVKVKARQRLIRVRVEGCGRRSGDG